ncbi:MAG: alpha/beta fold hydrolase [Bacteroidia bacterium]|nr:alpha/beta fold hydrolase [Bacteroidia bacterium]
MNFSAQRGKFQATPEKGEVSSLLVLPPKARALLVLGHGAGAGMDHLTMENIAQNMAHSQIATFRYNFPYMERGGGKDSNLTSIQTVQSAVREAKKYAGTLPILAGGHSFGGRMTSLAAAEGLIDEVKGLVFCSFPLHAPGKAGAERAAHLGTIRQPMLFLSGTRDTFISPEFFFPLIESLGEKATLHLLETADHGYKILKKTRQNPEDVFAEMARVTAEWLGRIF